MTAEPIDWITWREARDRTPEIWEGWRLRWNDADQAMVNSLRRGKVPVRLSTALQSVYTPAGAYPEEMGQLLWRYGKAIPLSEVVAGLLRLDFVLNPIIRAEYEVPVWGEVLGLGGYQSRPITVKKMAVVSGAELAWAEFYDDLVQYELPRGARPTLPRRSKSRSAAKQARQPALPKQAPDPQIHQEITAVYDQAEADGEKPPNVNQVIKPVQARLLSTRHLASGRKIRELAGDQKHAARRWKPGDTRKSKKHKVKP